MSDLVKRLQIPFPKDENTYVDLPVWVLELTSEAADKIEALEARIAAADKLADVAKKVDTLLLSFGMRPEFYRKASQNLRAALAAYQATKENTDG